MVKQLPARRGLPATPAGWPWRSRYRLVGTSWGLVVFLPTLFPLIGAPSGLSLGFWILVGAVAAAAVVSSAAWYRLARSEAELRFSEAKFAGIISIATDAIVSIDEGQVITDFNRGAEFIFGYRREEALGQRLGLLIPERLREAHARHVADFAESAATTRRMGERGSVDIIGLRKSGEEFPAEASISKMWIGGHVIMTVVLRDITARSRAERAEQLLGRAGSLFASSLDYETTIHSIVQLAVPEFGDWCAIDFIDAENKLCRLDAAAGESAGEPLLDALMQGKSVLDRRHPAWRAVESGEVQLIEAFSAEQLAALSDDVDQLEVLQQLGLASAVVAPLIARGRTLGAIAFYSREPGRYGEYEAVLAQKLAQRAAMAMDNARLYREAQQAARARDEVLSIVSHDLGNPLGAIFVNTRVLERALADTPDSTRAQPLTGIRRAAEQMEHLIRDLLDVQRIESGRLRLDPGRYTVEGLIAEAVERITPLAAEKSLRVAFASPEGLPPVRADRERVMQVFGNLLGNAIKFTEPGGSIAVAAETGSGAFVTFSVADTGVGIADADLAHVFDRYWQAQKSRRAGAGLGLAIARGIVEAHGGHIELASATGCGTTVTFSLPVADTAGSAGDEGSTAAEVRDPATNS